MAAIACDICGGSLSMDASGEFALCESCGMKHTKDRVRAKVQEVAGTVEVSNIANIESLMKRGHLALEESNWRQANEYFDKALDLNPEYAPAYIGKLCAEFNVPNEESLDSLVTDPISDSNNFKKAVRFTNAEHQAKLREYEQKINERIQQYSYLSAKDLFEVAAKGTVGGIQFFLTKKRVSVNYKNTDGLSLLHVVAGHNPDIEVIKYLVSQGADVNAIVQSAAVNSNIEIIKYLVSQGADVNTKTYDDLTPLHWAATKNIEIIKYLVSQGADVNAKDRHGNTPLHVAGNNPNAEVVKYLISQGADVNAKNNWEKQGFCRYCGGQMGGFFTKKCKHCGRESYHP